MSRFSKLARGGLALLRAAHAASDSRTVRIAQGEAKRYGEIAMLGLRPRPGLRL